MHDIHDARGTRNTPVNRFLIPTRTGGLFVVIAGIFWGCMGIFVRAMRAAGLSSFGITAIRLTVAGVCFAVIALVRDRRALCIRPRDIPLFLATGFGSIVMMSGCYYTAIDRLSMSAAAVLLYTSPVWVLLLSALFFREKITLAKLAALVLSVAGCILVSGFDASGDAVGILMGLASGLAYGLYSIFGTVAMKRRGYSPWTFTSVSFLVAAVGAWCISNPQETVTVFASAPNPVGLALLGIACGVFSAVCPFLLYTLGLARIEAGKAAILATTEPAVAFAVGVLGYGEPANVFSVGGILCIVGAVVLLNPPHKEETV